jgi:tetrahydrodipicolinate N-succinyltransferase
MRDAVGENCQLRAGIRVVAGTAIATVTRGLVYASDTFFSITRQSVPLKAKGKLRFAKDEGCIRIV